MGLFDPKQVSTQDHLDIADIRDDLIVLKTGKVSLVIETTSLNFDLLAAQEQDARIGSFAGLLNSLTFPIQIVIRTQRTDTSKYLTLLEEYKKKVNSVPIQQQVSIYQNFISKLTATTEILDKRFYAIIPTVKVASLVQPKGGALSLFSGGGQKAALDLRDVMLKSQAELFPKRDHLLKQFAGMGLAARQLRNDELIKLYYSIYEPDKVGLDVLNIRQDAISGAIVSADTYYEESDDGSSIVAPPTDSLEKRPLIGAGTPPAPAAPTN